MLYNMDWLQPGKQFPPSAERERIIRYHQNAHLFDVIISMILNFVREYLQE